MRTAPVPMSLDFTWPFLMSLVRTAPALMSLDFTWPFLMSPESTEFLPASAPAVPLIASTRTATIGASLGLRPVEAGSAAFPSFFDASIRPLRCWLTHS